MSDEIYTNLIYMIIKCICNEFKISSDWFHVAKQIYYMSDSDDMNETWFLQN